MRYVREKAFNLVPVFLLVTFVSFILLELLPGSAVDAILFDEDSAPPSPEVRAALMKEFGLDQPVVIRYFRWMAISSSEIWADRSKTSRRSPRRWRNEFRFLSSSF